WVDAGAREGDAKDAPPPVEWVDGWSIGKPDVVFEMPRDFDVPAAGTVEYQYIVIPSGFNKDTWVEAAEARPGNRTLVHHIIALVFAKQPPKERIFTANATNSKFVIPPGDPAYRADASITVQADARLVDVMPHMHFRGKDFQYRLVYPTGETQTVLSVPKYDFNWQLFYYFEQPVVLPKGTKIECTAHFDNSANNPANPNPAAEVRWGDQSWEEMMIGWFDLAID